VGPMEKAFDVVGDRLWHAGLTGFTASAPQPFAEKLVSYDTAFGGPDRNSENEQEHDAYLPNPVGRGWHKHLKNAWVDGKPLPNTEEIGKVVASPGDKYKPMSLGPLGRGWPQRACYAGTYDQHWQDNVFPFLPQDFDDRYYQAAPPDQQVPLPHAPMEVALSGFSGDGVRRFVIPHFDSAVHVFPKRGNLESYGAQLDTIVFEPDLERLTLTWRVTRPLRQNMFEVAQVVIGTPSKAWWRAKMSGKRHHASLGDAVAARRDGVAA